MKRTTMILAFAAMGLTVFAGGPKATSGKKIETLKVDAAQSTFKWHAKKVTGEHNGTVMFQGGELSLSNNTLAGGVFVIDMTTINNLDLTGEWHDKLVGHLKGDEFFAVEKNKTATLKIKSVEAINGAAPGTNNYNIKADLTIKGITAEISFPAMVIITKGQVIANADFMIDRTKYDIKYGSKSFFQDIGNKAIDDEFNVKVRIVAGK